MEADQRRETPAPGALPEADAPPPEADARLPEADAPPPEADARLPEADARVLTFLFEHRMVGAEHVERLLGISRWAAHARLRALRSAGLVRRERPFGGRAAFHLITTRGLRMVDSPLRAPRFDLSCHEHDLGLEIGRASCRERV